MPATINRHLTDRERAIVRFALRRVALDADGHPDKRENVGGVPSGVTPHRTVLELHDLFLGTEVVINDRDLYLATLRKLS